MAEKTIYITYELDGTLADAYSVKLSSGDGSYGIKSINPDATIVADDTDPDHPSTGRYEYTIDATRGTMYLVAWEIIPNIGETPIYKEEQLGPFEDLFDDGIRAVADSKGKYKPNSTAFLYLRITTIDGVPIDCPNVEVTIRDSSGGTVITGNPDKPADGFYVYEWAIDVDQTPGDYSVTWSYEIDNVTYYEAQEIIVAEDVSLYSTTYNPNAIALREALTYYIQCAQCIPVYYEQAKPSHNNKTYRFTFPRWNQTTGVKIYRNNKIVNSGIEINYFKGEVVFDSALTSYDMVHSDYSFRWFSDEELSVFLENACRDFNTYPPFTRYGLTVSPIVPNNFVPAIIRKAAIDAIRKIMLCLQFQQPQQVFGGEEGAAKAFSNFDTLKKNYEGDWQKSADNKKLGAYPSIKAIVVPEMTLPGGRCLIAGTAITYVIGDSLMHEEISIEKLYGIGMRNHNISVLSSLPHLTKPVFAPVNKIWISGYKSVYEVQTKTGYSVATSDEHLFFVDNKYIPVRYLREGDVLCVCDGDKISYDRIKKIKSYRRKEKMYDLEIGYTHNLFTNGIKTHNSRWFRQLFSGTAGT
jgi:hypothetical protein